MRPPPRLSNCYVPVPPVNPAKLTPANEFANRRKERILLGRKYSDINFGSSGAVTNQRVTHELRRLRMESNVLQSLYVSGSVLVELGRTKVICAVVGPVTEHCSLVPSSLNLSMDHGTLHVDVKYLPNIGYPTSQISYTNSIDAVTTQTSQQQPMHQKRRLHFMQQREYDLSTRIQTALSAAIPLHLYPKCAILVQFTILYDDGSIVPSCIAAASVSLANAGIEIFDVVTAFTVAIVSIPLTLAHENKKKDPPPVLLADPSLDEMSIADCIVTIAMLPNWNEVTLWEQQPFNRTIGTSAQVPFEVINAAVSLCQDGCRIMHRFIREHLRKDAAEVTQPG
jgi:exosome complex component MTR3